MDSYLRFEQHRFGERLRIERDHERAALSARVPPLVLQPIVENAVAHGVTSRVGPSTVLDPELRGGGRRRLGRAGRWAGTGRLGPREAQWTERARYRHAERPAPAAGSLRSGVRAHGEDAARGRHAGRDPGASAHARVGDAGRSGGPRKPRAAHDVEARAATVAAKPRDREPHHREVGPFAREEERMRLRALIVDDEAPARTHLRDLLGEIEGVELVGEASNAMEAEALLRAVEHDLVFLDIRMPGMDGVEAAEAVRRVAQGSVRDLHHRLRGVRGQGLRVGGGRLSAEAHQQGSAREGLDAGVGVESVGGGGPQAGRSSPGERIAHPGVRHRTAGPQDGPGRRRATSPI